MKLEYLLLFLCLLFIRPVCAQPVPTIQDCLGAIPICQNVYTTSISYHGSGNYNDIPWAGCLALGGESNSVWYTFTTQTSGNFSFILTPNTTSDYDWAVFNITNAKCSDLYNNFNSLVVSCNSSGYQSATGISTASGGTGNNASWNYSNPFNEDLSAQTGETYVLMISDWSNASGGYTLDFSSSTALLFNNTSPYILTAVSNPAYQDSTLTFRFSENILCNTVDSCDFTLTGPGGPYSITDVTATGCASGGNNERIFTLSFTPPLSSGTFNLNLIASGCGSITDACGNLALSSSFSFSTSMLSVSLSSSNTASNRINIYPNPSSQNVTISLPDEKGEVVIMDMTGRIVLSRFIRNENKLLIDVIRFDKGIYTILFNTDKNSYIEKMIKD